MRVVIVIFVLFSIWDFGVCLKCYKCDVTVGRNCLKLEEIYCPPNPPVFNLDDDSMALKSSMSDLKCITVKTNNAGSQGIVDRNCLWSTPGLSTNQVCNLIGNENKVQFSHCSTCDTDLCNNYEPVDNDNSPQSQISCYSCRDATDPACIEQVEVDCPGEDPLGSTSFWENNNIHSQTAMSRKVEDIRSSRNQRTQINCLTIKVQSHGVNHLRRGCVYSLPGSSYNSICMHLQMELVHKLEFCLVCEGALCNTAVTRMPTNILIFMTPLTFLQFYSFFTAL